MEAPLLFTTDSIVAFEMGMPVQSSEKDEFEVLCISDLLITLSVVEGIVKPNRPIRSLVSRSVEARGAVVKGETLS